MPMNWEEAREEEAKVEAFLDSIDLLAEMTVPDEDIFDFEDRLEEKYPYKTERVETLFDAYSVNDFADYLKKRYKDKVWVHEHTCIEVRRRD